MVIIIIIIIIIIAITRFITPKAGFFILQCIALLKYDTEVYTEEHFLQNLLSACVGSLSKWDLYQFGVVYAHAINFPSS